MTKQREIIRVGGHEDEDDYTYLALPTLKDPNSDWDWQVHGQCLRTPDLDFFALESPTNRTKCKVVCSACPVQAECLAFAQANAIVDGIWGGYTPNERKKL